MVPLGQWFLEEMVCATASIFHVAQLLQSQQSDGPQVSMNRQHHKI